jgi:pyruvate/2-oxoglutarate dehydrogenase complex dihydrolipoamide dehydrogenase (E3) component
VENEPIHTDICVIGAGSGGLSVAAGAAQMGASTVLVEKGRMGGDCLNYGCVPSKALLAAAHAAETMRGAETFGVTGGPPMVDFSRVHDHVAGVIAAIAPHDSQQRFEELGVQVIREAARFTGLREVTAGGHAIRARRFVIATGSSPLVPPIVGLEDAPFLTNESLFDLVSVPGHLIIIGGAPSASKWRRPTAGWAQRSVWWKCSPSCPMTIPSWLMWCARGSPPRGWPFTKA